jgi:hypothetical protein
MQYNVISIYMLKLTEKKFQIEPIIEQVLSLGNFGKRLYLNECTGKLLNGPYRVKPEYIGTPLGNVLEELGPIGEARLLRLEPSETYSAHSDPDDRLHLAIITNPHAYLIDFDEKRMYHLPADGNIWYMDTAPIHVAANFGPRDRIHLNIRMLLPHFTYPGYKLSIVGGDFDWKQESYIELMSFFNKSIKEKIITGFEKIDDRSLLFNIKSLDFIFPYIKKLESKGFKIDITKKDTHD